SGRRHALGVWDLTTEGAKETNPPKSPARYHGALAYAPDGKTVASGSHDGTVRLWDVTDPGAPTGRFVLDAHKTPKAPENDVPAVAFAPDGKTLVSGGDDGVLHFWDLTGDKPAERAALRLDKGPVSSVQYSPDGNKLVVAFASGYVFVGDSSGKKLR